MTIEKIIEIDDRLNIPEGTDKVSMMKQRVNQYFFRMTVLNAYENKCCVTGLKESMLLIASHIKPWSVSNAKTERTNPQNGLCLNALHDRAFDMGLITINKKYEIVISSQLKNVHMDETTKNWFMMYDHKTIALPDKFSPDLRFIEYHNDMIFKN